MDCADISADTNGSVHPICSFTPSQLSSAFGELIAVVMIGAAIIAFFVIVYGGIKWIISGGNPDKTAEARRTIFGAIIGLAIVFFSISIMKILGSVLGFDITNLTIPNFGN